MLHMLVMHTDTDGAPLFTLCVHNMHVSAGILEAYV